MFKMNLKKLLVWNENYAMILCFVLSGIVMMVSFGLVLEK